MAAIKIQQVGCLLALATIASAQGFGGFGGGGNNGGGNPFSSGGDSGSGSNGGSGSSNGGSSSDFGPPGNADFSQYTSRGRHIIAAHAVLGTLAFAFFFPVGGILIRLGSFRGLWLVHAAIQAFAYLLYIAAFGIGIWMAKNFYTLNQAHPIIGIVLFVLLFFQPFLGFIHHVMFKKHSRRIVWSYGHIWLGRAIITLGIINGGLGLQLAKRTHFYAPSNGVIIGYSVAAAIMWCVYIGSAIYGEIKRSRASRDQAPPPYKYESHNNSDTEPGAPHGINEYYKEQRTGQNYA